MKFNKQLFYRALAIFAILDLCILLAGCGDWESQASSIIGLLGPAITAALEILVAFGLGISPTVLTAFNSWETAAQEALTTIKTLIVEYKAAAAADQPGILGEIQAALATVSGNLGTLLGQLHITDSAVQAKIAAVFGAIVSMLAAVLNLIPVVQNQVANPEDEFRLYRTYKENAKNFKASFNAAAGQFGAKYEI